MNWCPLSPSLLQTEIGSFKDWVLCGGHSVAVLVGRNTRAHGDTDIGVFRSQTTECLQSIGKKRVYLCRGGSLALWSGDSIPSDVHDIWITDSRIENWIFQVLIFDDDGEAVFYRREPRIRWPKSAHSWVVDGQAVLNPFVTFLFKANRTQMELKDIHDLNELIARIPQTSPKQHS